MKNLIIALLLTLLIPVWSCKKILDVESTRSVSEENMWNKLEDARAGLFGIYGLHRAALSDNGRHHIYGEVRMADFDGTTRDDFKAIHRNQLNADFPLINQLADWRRFYATINAANIFLERIPEVKKQDPRYVDQTYNLDIAQAKALRAFSYFYITRIWGDVPLILSSHDGSFENKARDPQDKVLAQAEQDLLEAEPKLPYVYDGGDPEQTGQYYSQPASTFDQGILMSKQGVWAILANLYAWRGDYAKVAQYTQKIIDLGTVVDRFGGFRLDGAVFPLDASQATKVFRGSALTETRTKIVSVGRNWRSAEFSMSGCIEEYTMAEPLVTNRAIPVMYVPKDTLLSIYDESGDTRFGINPVTKAPTTEVWFTAYDKKYPLLRKILATNDQPTNGGVVTLPVQFATFASALVFSRLDDNGLLLAEARAVLNDKTNAEIMLNKVRQRHGLPAYNPSKNGSLIDAIFKERRRELIGEGWRWYDIIRYKKIKNDDVEFNKLIASGGIYWPIARTVLANNPLLTQYPHWQ